MGSPVADRLPEGLRRELAELVALEERLLAGIALVQQEDLDALAEAREQKLVDICDALAGLEDPLLRRDALLAMAEANETISKAATEAMEETMSLVQRSMHQHKAISAYGAMEDDRN